MSNDAVSWSIFISLTSIFIYADLYLLGKKGSHKVSFKEALTWSIIWFILAILFNIYIYLHTKNVDKALEFLAGYLIEKSLSLDNIFVFISIFQYFAVPQEYQKKVLTIGILTAVIARAIFIFLGSYLISKFYWILYIFGVILIYSGFKILRSKEESKDISKMWVVRVLSKHLPLKDSYEKDKFIVKRNGNILFTPLTLVLLTIEFSDIVFAIDSIPAIFAVTLDPFIVYTSNIFAILGLRALYFLLAGLKSRFKYMKEGISIILMYVGIKLLISHFVEIKPIISVTLIFTTITVSILISIIEKRRTNAST